MGQLTAFEFRIFSAARMFTCSNALLAEGQRRSGGTGRRAGFKILSWQQGEGSTPSFGIGIWMAKSSVGSTPKHKIVEYGK
jgi:hypothetical protein